MWIVRLALRRPYTFVVVALLLVVLGVVTVQRMPTDIFPNVDIPVVTVIWSFTGIAPEDMPRLFGRHGRTTIRADRPTIDKSE